MAFSPYNFAKLDTHVLLDICACCNTPLRDPGFHAPLANRILVWQRHLGSRCGGDDRRLHAHEAVKLTMKRLVLSCLDPAGCAFPKISVMLEPPHLRHGQSRPGDIYAVGNSLHMKDTCMDIVITLVMPRSCLSYPSKSSDHSIRKVENDKFRKNARFAGPI
jgi:hypothetical protein